MCAVYSQYQLPRMHHPPPLAAPAGQVPHPRRHRQPPHRCQQMKLVLLLRQMEHIASGASRRPHPRCRHRAGQICPPEWWPLLAN